MENSISLRSEDYSLKITGTPEIVVDITLRYNLYGVVVKENKIKNPCIDKSFLDFYNSCIRC